MAKIIQIIDVDSEGHKLRLDDGKIVTAKHSGATSLEVGQEFVEITQPVNDDAPESEPGQIHEPTVNQLNSDAQAEAQKESEAVRTQTEAGNLGG